MVFLLLLVHHFYSFCLLCCNSLHLSCHYFDFPVFIPVFIPVCFCTLYTKTALRFFVTSDVVKDHCHCVHGNYILYSVLTYLKLSAINSMTLNSLRVSRAISIKAHLQFVVIQSPAPVPWCPVNKASLSGVESYRGSDSFVIFALLAVLHIINFWVHHIAEDVQFEKSRCWKDIGYNGSITCCGMGMVALFVFEPGGQLKNSRLVGFMSVLVHFSRTVPVARTGLVESAFLQLCVGDTTKSFSKTSSLDHSPMIISSRVFDINLTTVCSQELGQKLLSTMCQQKGLNPEVHDSNYPQNRALHST